MYYNEGSLCLQCTSFIGIPPHVALMNDISTINTNIACSKMEMISKLKNELTTRWVGGEVFQANAILEDVSNIHEKIKI